MSRRQQALYATGICITLAGIFLANSQVRAQGIQRPTVQRPTVTKPGFSARSGSFAVVSTSQFVVRYDPATGAAESLTTSSNSGSVAYSWKPVSDPTLPKLSGADRFQIVAGTNQTGHFVRLDRVSGDTWVAVANGNELSWSFVAK